MKYVKTFEEVKWFRRLKNPKQIMNSLEEIIPLDKDKELNKKIDEAAKEINIHGVNFIASEGSNLDMFSGDLSKIYYKSKVDIKVPIEGYINTNIELKKIKKTLNGVENHMILSIAMSFDYNSTVSKICNMEGWPHNKNGSYVFSKNRINNACTISETIIKTIGYEDSKEDIKEQLISTINQLIDIDFKSIQNTIDTLKAKRLEKIKIEQEYVDKCKNLRSKKDEISDYLIDLEEMSTEHEDLSEEYKDGKIVLTYYIPGIEIGRSDPSNAKLVINDVILNIMSIIKTFTKRAKKEIEGVIIKSTFGNNKVTIKLSIPPIESNHILSPAPR